ncbi:hypothetical protein WA026_022599 [Henosepilachna vigintioctopunctata]|uniref:Amine oxidase domain-containing protein n=1 Tax=Henosepilachna vigintioctopunctata TaxID=420089 RepID=A0AAW1UXA0_9CUCU
MWWLMFFVLFFGCAAAEKIIIIGAGAAGIATASKLLDQKFTDFRILEAQNRIGGRIHTFHLGEAFVDLGAQYLHGGKGNVAYELAKDYIKPGSEIDKAWIAYKGREKTGENLVDQSFIIQWEAYESDEPYLSLGESFLARYNASVLEKYKNDAAMLEYAKDFIRSAENVLLLMDGAYTWNNLSSTGSFDEADGDQYLSWDGRGAKTILEILLKNYPKKTGYNLENHLSLKKSVSKIILNGNNVKVKCNDGSEYTAEHVVFTPSLGVLKHDHGSIFQPRLSDEKVAAIENFGFGCVVKIIFQFSNAWWGESKTFVFVWSEEDRKSIIKEVPFGPVKNGDHWLTSFISLGPAPNNSKILIGWIDGMMVPEVEKLSNEEIKNGTVFAMKKFLGKDFDITDPIKVIHSTWYSNPNFRGGYTHETVAMKKKNIFSPQQALLKPVTDEDGVPRILFAGEATHPTRYSTVDGAIATGFREGERLIEIMKKKDTKSS